MSNSGSGLWDGVKVLLLLTEKSSPWSGRSEFPFSLSFFGDFYDNDDFNDYDDDDNDTDDDDNDTDDDDNDTDDDDNDGDCYYFHNALLR